MTLGFNTLFQQRDVRETATTARGTSYWSCPGQNFHASDPDVDDINHATGSSTCTALADNTYFIAVVELPHGAVITGAVVTGDAAAGAEVWSLRRTPFITDGSTSSILATAAINTEDTTISNATVDNSTYCYYFSTTGLDTNDDIWGARITYTI